MTQDLVMNNLKLRRSMESCLEDGDVDKAEQREVSRVRYVPARPAVWGRNSRGLSLCFCLRMILCCTRFSWRHVLYGY